MLKNVMKYCTFSVMGLVVTFFIVEMYLNKTIGFNLFFMVGNKNSLWCFLEVQVLYKYLEVL